MKIVGVPRKLVVAGLFGIALFLLLRKGALWHLFMTLLIGEPRNIDTNDIACPLILIYPLESLMTMADQNLRNASYAARGSNASAQLPEHSLQARCLDTQWLLDERDT